MDLHDIDDILRSPTHSDDMEYNNMESDNASESNDESNELNLLRDLFGKSDNNTLIKKTRDSEKIARPQLYRDRLRSKQNTDRHLEYTQHWTNSIQTRQADNIRVIPKINVPKGLFNLGNTCFLNVILQSLKSSIKFQEFINSDLSQKLMLEKHISKGCDINDSINNINSSLTYHLKSLFLLLNDSENSDSICPKNLRIKLATFSEIFENDLQHDIAEALSIIIEAVHIEHSQDISVDNDAENELQKACNSFWYKDHSPIVELFYSMGQELKSCRNCSYKSVSHFPYHCIHLDIPIVPKNESVDYAGYLCISAKNPNITLSSKEINKMTKGLNKSTKEQIVKLDEIKRSKKFKFKLSKCLENYFKKGSIDEAICGDCKSIGYDTNFKFNIAPKILILQIKRFESGVKRSNPIELMQTFNMNIGGLKQTYNISSVLNHSGINIQSGHYYMYGKNRTGENIINENWYLFNDGNVEPCIFESIDLRDVYMIFYELE